MVSAEECVLLQGADEGIERSVTYKKTVVESFIAFMLRSVFQGSNWAATSPVLKLWEVSRSFIINLTQFTLVGEAGKKKFIGRMCARARDETGEKIPRRLLLFAISLQE